MKKYYYAKPEVKMLKNYLWSSPHSILSPIYLDTTKPDGDDDECFRFVLFKCNHLNGRIIVYIHFGDVRLCILEDASLSILTGEETT